PPNRPAASRLRREPPRPPRCRSDPCPPQSLEASTLFSKEMKPRKAAASIADGHGLTCRQADRPALGFYHLPYQVLRRPQVRRLGQTLPGMIEAVGVQI